MSQVTNIMLHALSETVSPMTHMMGTSGNEAIINRERVQTPEGTRSVPVLSGNAIRHRCIREPGAKYLIGRYNIRGALNIDELNYMFNGGSLTENSTNEDMTRVAEMQELFPLFRLLGGSLRNQVIGGSINVMRGALVCEENRAIIQRQLPEDYVLPDDPLLPAETYVSQYQYTRGDVKRQNPGMLTAAKVEERQTELVTSTDGFDDDMPGEKSNLMIYSGQSIIPGALWYHGFVMQGVSPLEVGALLHSLQRWQNTGGTLGGQARIGHGKLNTRVWSESKYDADEYIRAYIDHVDQVKDRAVEWLNDTFPTKKKAKS